MFFWWENESLILLALWSGPLAIMSGGVSAVFGGSVPHCQQLRRSLGEGRAEVAKRGVCDVCGETPWLMLRVACFLVSWKSLNSFCDLLKAMIGCVKASSEHFLGKPVEWQRWHSSTYLPTKYRFGLRSITWNDSQLLRLVCFVLQEDIDNVFIPKEQTGGTSYCKNCPGEGNFSIKLMQDYSWFALL